MNAHTQITEQPAPAFPPVYAMVLNLNGSTAEGYTDGDLLKVDTQFLPDVGDLVCVHMRSGNSYIMRMELALPPDMWERMPYRENPKSEVHALFVGKLLGQEHEQKCRTIPLQDCWAIHVIDGKLSPEECAV
jgi:hypothetical protein